MQWHANAMQMHVAGSISLFLHAGALWLGKHKNKPSGSAVSCPDQPLDHPASSRDIQYEEAMKSIVVQCISMNAMKCQACRAMSCNVVQCRVVQCNVMQCHAMLCNAVQCDAMSCNACKCNVNVM